MTYKEIIKVILEENLTLDLNFRTYTYDGTNELEVEVKFDGEVVASDTVTLNVTTEKGYC